MPMHNSYTAGIEEAVENGESSVKPSISSKQLAKRRKRALTVELSSYDTLRESFLDVRICITIWITFVY